MTTINSTEGKQELEPGADGHVHRFGVISVPPEYGHSYVRCVGCSLSKHLPEHDPAMCAICSRASVAAPQRDLRIRDREGKVVTQGAFNALMVKLDSLTEDAELAAEDADRVRGELGTVYANMLRDIPDEKCILCGHERRTYNAEADACEHVTGLTQAQFDVFCGCACRFTAAAAPVAPVSTPEPKSLLRDPMKIDVTQRSADIPPPIVTRDGLPCADQAAALEEFKEHCRAATSTTAVIKQAAHEIKAEVIERVRRSFNPALPIPAEPIEDVIAAILSRYFGEAKQETHAFDPVGNDVDECECGLTKDAEVHSG